MLRPSSRSRNTNIVSTNGEKCAGGFITPPALMGLTVRPAGVRIMATISYPMSCSSPCSSPCSPVTVDNSH
ncbi:hypothetical protein ANTQUA_LOCUS10333 [Anthophora quadrimaculata]